MKRDRPMKKMPHTASMLDARNYFSRLPDQLTEYLDPLYQCDFDNLMGKLDQYFDIVATVNMQAQDNYFIKPSEATEIGDEGFIMLLKLLDLMDRLDLPDKRIEIEQISLVFARWIIRYQGQLRYIEPIVKALAQLASILHDKPSLLSLADQMGEISDACAPETRQLSDDKNQPGAWCLLQINRSMVATRTQDIDMMTRAFDELLMYLPDAAASFFESGINQIDTGNYPQYVLDIIVRYHGNKPSKYLH
jgi:hypothetical protein